MRLDCLARLGLRGKDADDKQEDGPCDDSHGISLRDRGYGRARGVRRRAARIRVPDGSKRTESGATRGS
jgi:hypothetical protein